jgi:hypothetical protein
LELLFVAAHWHGLAKLRMHNDLTLDIMDAVTASFGDKLRIFNQTTCAAFITRELEREFNARVRRQAKEKRTQKQAANRAVPVCHSGPAGAEAGDQRSDISSTEAIISESAAASQPDSITRRLKTLNLNTYKWHSLGDYTTTIRRYGTMDSYSTEPVSRQWLSLNTYQLFYLGRAGTPLTKRMVHPH